MIGLEISIPAVGLVVPGLADRGNLVLPAQDIVTDLSASENSIYLAIM